MRRRVRVAGYTVVGVAAALIGAVWILQQSERVDEAYATHRSFAARHPAVARYLPPEVHDIRALYYIDLPTLWATFRYPAARLDMAGSPCEPVQPDALRRSDGPSPPWWPSELASDASGGRNGYEFWRCELEAPYPAYQGRPTAYVAFRSADGRGYWWELY
jgi:hypothetical protein